MKKIALLLVVLALCCLMVGCGREASVVSGATESAATVAVDTSQLWYRGEIIIFNGDGFAHECNVIDYVDGDPAGLYGGSSDNVVGIYAVQPQGSNEIKNAAVLTDGSVVMLDTSLRVLPREQSSFVLNGESKDKHKILLRLGLDNDEYTMSIVRPGKATKTVNRVLDVWKAYDTIYWMVGDIVYRLNWWDEEAEEPEVYFEGANGVSHCSDEAEGALVPLEKANYKAYGRDDIYSPYGDLSKH